MTVLYIPGESNKWPVKSKAKVSRLLSGVPAGGVGQGGKISTIIGQFVTNPVIDGNCGEA